MTDRERAKIRIVSLDKKSPADNSGSRTAACTCEGDNCPECRVQCPFNCQCDGEPPCPAHCPVICDCDVKPCDCDQEEKKQQSSKKEKVKPRTFFKIAEKRK